MTANMVSNRVTRNVSYGLSGRSDHVRAIIYSSWVIAFGDTDCAAFMFMLSRWYDKGHRGDGFIYKSYIEIANETGLTMKQQRRIRSVLEKKGVIQVKKMQANGHPTLHWKLNKIRAQELITKAEEFLDKMPQQ